MFKYIQYILYLREKTFLLDQGEWSEPWPVFVWQLQIVLVLFHVGLTCLFSLQALSTT